MCIVIYDTRFLEYNNNKIRFCFSTSTQIYWSRHELEKYWARRTVSPNIFLNSWLDQ